MAGIAAKKHVCNVVHFFTESKPKKVSIIETVVKVMTS